MNKMPLSFTWSSVKYKPLILIIIVVLSLLPFSNKPFHIDDTVFIYSARNILTNPLKPYDFNMSWSGSVNYCWAVNKNPPLWPYLLAVSIKFFSEEKIPLHMAYLIFPVISILAMYALARKFVKDRFLPTLFLLVSPAFFVSSTNLMGDLPQLAFYLSSLALYIKGFDEDRPIYFALAGLLAGCAILSKYAAVTILIIFFFYNFVFQNDYRRSWTAFLIPVSMLLIWGLHGIYFYGKPHFLNFSNAPAFWGKSNIAGAILTGFAELLVFLSGVSLFIFFFRIGLPKENKNIARIASISIFISALLLTLYIANSFSDRAEFLDFIFVFVFLTATFLFFRNCVIYYLKNRDDKTFMFLFSWFLLNAYIVIFLFAVSARFVLTALPPMALLISHIMEKDGFSAIRKKYVYGGCVLVFMVSILVAHSDYCLASSYKNFTDIIKKTMVDKRIYFTGNWGFQYYMEKNGFRPFDYLNTSIEKGDVVISPISNPGLYTENMNKIARIKGMHKDQRRGLFRIMFKAGFYGSGFGPLPYAPGADFAEAYLYYEVIKPFKGRLL